MAVKTLNLLSFPIFDITEGTTIATRWKKYKRKFEILCNTLAVTADKQKVSMLLNYVGDDTFEIYENILNPDEENSYDDVITALNRHFEPKVNHSYETYLFRSMKQKSEETIQQYYIRLKEQSTKCAFTEADKEIKQQIELHTINNKLRRFSFRNPTKSLQELLLEAKTIEDMKVQTQKVEETEEKEINAARHNNSRKGKNSFHERKMSSTPKCFRCGEKYPHEKSCPAQQKECFKCGKLGHFGKACRTKSKQYNHKFHPKPTNGNHRTHNRRPINKVTHSSDHTSEESDSDEYLYCLSTLFSQINHISRKDKPDFHTIIKIEQQKVQVLIDSGASINIMNARTFEGLNKHLKTPIRLSKTDIKVVTYGTDKPSLKIKGVAEVFMETKQKYKHAKVYVIETNHKNLLSGETAVQLGLLTLNIHSVLEINTSNKISDSSNKLTPDSPKIETKPKTMQQPNNKTPDISKPTKTSVFEEVPKRIRHLVKQYENTIFSGKIGRLTNCKIKVAPTPFGNYQHLLEK